MIPNSMPFLLQVILPEVHCGVHNEMTKPQFCSQILIYGVYHCMNINPALLIENLGQLSALDVCVKVLVL